MKDEREAVTNLSNSLDSSNEISKRHQFVCNTNSLKESLITNDVEDYAGAMANPEEMMHTVPRTIGTKIEKTNEINFQNTRSFDENQQTNSLEIDISGVVSLTDSSDCDDIISLTISEEENDIDCTTTECTAYNSQTNSQIKTHHPVYSVLMMVFCNI